MRRAGELAVAQRPHPNPRVGAVVLDREGNPVGEAAHLGPGHPHAEAAALQAAGAAAAGGTLVLTLEPCNHHGRTPPCTEAVLAAGVARVVVGAVDADPRVRGSGIRRLQEAGVVVELWPHPEEMEAVDPAYFHHRRSGLPRFTLKAALTLDGQIAALDGTSRWITGSAARQDAHLLRAQVDGVMVGAGTLREDDPQLTVRLPGYDGPQPQAVVVTASGRLPATARLWRPGTLVVTPQPLPLEGVEQLVVAAGPGGVDLREAARLLGERGMLDILVEGGGGLAASLWEAGLVHRGVFYLAARLAGGSGVAVFNRTFSTLADASEVEIDAVHRIGPDLRVDWTRRET